MPLWVEVKLRLVDEDDPRTVVVEHQGSQEEEQFQLSCAEVVHRETRPPVPLVEDLEGPGALGVRVREADEELVTAAGIESRPAVVDARHPSGVFRGDRLSGTWETLSGGGVCQLLLHV